MKRLLIILLFATLSGLLLAQPAIQTPATIGSSSRNQRIAKSLIVEDTIVGDHVYVQELQIFGLGVGNLVSDASGNVGIGFAPTYNYAITYAQAVDSANSGNLVPNAWYNITDDSLYIQAITDSSFALNGYYADSSLWELDAIQFDFTNEHIQQRCDRRGNCVGAAFGIIDNGLISVDPIFVFAWGNDFVVGNTVKDAVLDLTNIVGVGDAFIISNHISQQSEVIVGNNGALQFQKNNITKGATWTCLYATGLIFDNDFSYEIVVNTDSVDVQMEGNTMFGSQMYYTINGSSGNFLYNDGQGHLQSRDCVDCNIRDNNFFNGAYIFADSLTGDLNANELHRGSEIHMVKSDSAFSKNYLDFTAIVHADSTHNRTEYNRFIGCGSGFGTNFYVRMTTSGQINGYNIFSCDTVTLNNATIYNHGALDTRTNIRYTSLPIYANDAAADADTDLLSGSLYQITADRTVYLKP
jgi:hypothetical protein